MAHFALINNENLVIDVIVVDNKNCGGGQFPDSEASGQEFIKKLGLEGRWKQTSYNNNFRLHYANVGSFYDELSDIFILPKPFNSWILNNRTFEWESPIPYPGDGEEYYWDEKNIKWTKAN